MKFKNVDTIPSIKHTIIKSGDLGVISNGGIYNPGIIAEGDNYVGIVRVEENYRAYSGERFHSTCHPFYIVLDKQFKVVSCHRINLPEYKPRMRVEDFRVFKHYTTTYVGHASHVDGSKQEWQQGLSKLNFNTNTMELVQLFDANADKRSEKNWGWFDSVDSEFQTLTQYVYSVFPWKVMRYLHNKKTTIVSRTHQPTFNGGQKSWFDDGRLVSVSSNPVPYNDGQHIMFVHAKVDKLYVQTAMLFDTVTLMPTYFIRENLLTGGNEGGVNPFVMYISSVVVEKDRVLLFYGAGDADTKVAIIDRKTLDGKFKQYRLW